MTRMIRSSVLLAACLGLWSCTSDPTADEAGVPTAILTSPEVNFILQGEEQLVKFGLVDELGGLIPSTWTIGAVPPEFSVEIDSGYRVIYNNGDSTLSFPDLQSEIRVTVKGLLGGAGSFTVSASGITQTVTVNIVPTTVPATITPAASAFGDTVVVTMPAGYSLAPDMSFTVGVDDIPGYVVSVAGDGSSAQVFLPPGISGTLTITGVMLDFLPGATVTLPTVASASRASQDIIAAAGVLPALPAVGGTLTVSDAFSQSPQMYRFVVTVTTTLLTTLDWVNVDGDYDGVFYDAAGARLGYFGLGTYDKPEQAAHTFAPGTYYFGPELYTGDYSPITYTFEVVPTP